MIRSHSAAKPVFPPDIHCRASCLASYLRHASLCPRCPPHSPLVSVHAHYMCPSLLVSRESLVTNLETSHLLYLFLPQQDISYSCLYPRSGIKRFIKHVWKRGAHISFESSQLLLKRKVSVKESAHADFKKGPQEKKHLTSILHY